MKANKLYAALAITSLALPFTAVADDDISSRLANGKFSGEAFGGAYRSSQDLDDGSAGAKTDTTDFTSDRVRLAYHAEVKENMIFGAELELFPGSEASSSLSGTRLQDLFFQWNHDNYTKTIGRFKQSVNRENAVENSDARFTRSAGFGSLLTSPMGFGFTSAEAAAFTSALGGASRRIEGGELIGTVDGGLNYTVAIYKGGTDSTGGDSERSFGYSGSIGWQGGDDAVQFGANLGLFMEQGNESDDTVVPDETTNIETGGYRFGANVATGPFTGNIYYADNTIETDTDGVADQDTDVSSIGFEASFDLGGADRAYDNLGILQGPSNLSRDSRGYEVVAHYSVQTLEQTGSSDIDIDRWGLGVNAYCGEYTKIYGSYTSLEIDGGGSAKPNTDELSIGVRFDF